MMFHCVISFYPVFEDILWFCVVLNVIRCFYLFHSNLIFDTLSFLLSNFHVPERYSRRFRFLQFIAQSLESKHGLVGAAAQHLSG